MSGQAPQIMHRRGNQGRHRSNNEAAKSKTNGNAANSASKKGESQEKTSEAAAKTENGKPPKSKPQNEGEKLVVRRLPPGMTEAEFWSILGEEWEVGKGRVDWFSYSEGKVPKDPSKPSRPSRAYLHVKRKDEIMPLSEAVRSKTWEDASGTHTSTSLIAPPSVEFSIYKKVPSNKKRTDTRQGTIDQDPEFMAFLESLANPTQPKDGEAEEDEADKDVKITTTPLIEFLKEKKAAKSKENSSKRQAKNAQGEGGKGKGGSKDDDHGKKKGKASKDDKPKEPVKILTKKAATEQAAEAAKAAATQINAAAAPEAPKSRRAGIAAAARLLQRDLGLSPGSAHRRARQDAAKADTDAKTEGNDTVSRDTAASAATAPLANANERPASPAPSDAGSQTSKAGGQAPTKSQKRANRGAKGAEKSKTSDNSTSQPVAPPKPTVILKKKPEGEGQTLPPPETQTVDKPNEAKSGGRAAGSKANQPKKPAGISQDVTRAFVKHVNASQGVTEETLREGLQSFGTITSVEIDKRKGFAYVEFTEHDALVQAIAASPITVGQGSVQVLERKEKKPAAHPAGSAASGESSSKNEKGGGRGRRGRGGGGGGGNKNAGGDKGQSPVPSAAPAASTTEGGS